jgi:hypothetical protein
LWRRRVLIVVLMRGRSSGRRISGISRIPWGREKGKLGMKIEIS